MIPLRDVIPSRTTPYITATLIGLNALVWVYELTLPRELVPALLHTHGVTVGQLSPPTLVTSLFLHSSWTHVIANTWALWIFGESLEDTMGHGRFAAFYVLCGALAGLGYAAVAAATALPIVGAGGTLAAMMGGYFVLFPQSRVLTLIPLVIRYEIVEVPALALLVVWVTLQVISPGAIARSAGPQTLGAEGFLLHLAGFAIGVVAVLLFRPRAKLAERWSSR
jgi:membrane associated rhomboid family serine protease